MSFEDDMKENVPGCPKTYDPKHEVCKDCSLAGDCRRSRLEDLAMDPEQMGKAIALAQKYADKLQKEEFKKKMENLPKAIPIYEQGVIKMPKPSIDGFLNLFMQFQHKMKEKGIRSGRLHQLFQLFIQSPSYLFEGVEPPPPAPPEPPESPPPTPEKVEQEVLRMNDPESCYRCAMGKFAYRPKGRFPAGEATIMKSPEFACKYARDVLKMPWAEAEKTIATDPQWAYEYTSVQLGRFHAGEQAIASSPEFAYKYARHTLGKRWPKAEAVILADSEWGPEYKDYFQIKTVEKE